MTSWGISGLGGGDRCRGNGSRNPARTRLYVSAVSQKCILLLVFSVVQNRPIVGMVARTGAHRERSTVHQLAGVEVARRSVAEHGRHSRANIPISSRRNWRPSLQKGSADAAKRKPAGFFLARRRAETRSQRTKCRPMLRNLRRRTLSSRAGERKRDPGEQSASVYKATSRGRASNRGDDAVGSYFANRVTIVIGDMSQCY
jgi:hypothetical protein